MSDSKQTKIIFIIINICFYTAVAFFLYYSYFVGTAAINEIAVNRLPAERFNELDHLDFLNSLYAIFMVVLVIGYFVLLVMNILQGFWLRVYLNTAIVILLIPIYYLSGYLVLISSVLGLMLMETLRALFASPMSFFSNI